MKARALQRSRFDGYAKPIAPVREATVESLYERGANQRMRDHIWHELEAQYRALLCRGTHAELTLRIGIKDGMLMEEARTTVEQRHFFGSKLSESGRPFVG